MIDYVIMNKPITSNWLCNYEYQLPVIDYVINELAIVDYVIMTVNLDDSSGVH